MISNPLSAIHACRDIDELVFVMEEAFKGVMKRQDGGDYTRLDWFGWSCKYDSFPKARKCAGAMYCRVLKDRRIPNV
jgi:hypothetical protein